MSHYIFVVELPSRYLPSGGMLLFMASFRAGGAVSLRRAGAPDSVIKRIGRWKSNAWKHYVPEDLSLEEKFAKLVSSTPVPPAAPQEDPWIRGGWSAMMEP